METRIINNAGSFNSFEERYLETRKKENRLYSMKELKMLPDVPADHQYHNEWMIRKRSAGRLIKYINKKETPLKLLDVGCGNGWLSALIARETGCEVTAADINREELVQAREAFRYPNLHFIYGTPGTITGKYDLILFAASIQYFPSLKNVIEKCFTNLEPNGEIHIIDTFFYHRQEVIDARERTRRYYEEIGAAEMSEWYFHHTFEELSPYDHTLFHSRSIMNRIRGNDPFPWVRIR